MLDWKKVTEDEFIYSVSDKEAIIVSRDLFQWLSENPDDGKSEYPADIFIPFLEHSSNQCALCSTCYTCKDCAMYSKWWGSENTHKQCSSIKRDTPYSLWWDSPTLYDRSFFALLLVDNFNYVLDTEYGGEFNIEDVT